MEKSAVTSKNRLNRLKYNTVLNVQKIMLSWYEYHSGCFAS